MSSHCFRCGAALRTVYRAGKIRTIDSGGEEHWKSCGARRQARKPEQKSLLGTAPQVQGRTVVGENYKPQCAGCPALPWAPCPCFPRAA